MPALVSSNHPTTSYSGRRQAGTSLQWEQSFSKKSLEHCFFLRGDLCVFPVGIILGRIQSACASVKYVCNILRHASGHLCEAQSNCTHQPVTAKMHYHRATHITVELQLVFMSVSPLKNLLDIIMEVQIGLWEHVKASIHISGYYLVLFVSLLLKQRERKSNTS